MTEITSEILPDELDTSTPVEKAVKLSGLKKDAAYVYGGYFLRYLSLLILIPYYGHVLGPNSYGKVLAAMSLMNIIWMTVNYGFSTTGARAIALSATRQERSEIVGCHIKARLLLVPVGIMIGTIGTMASSSLNVNPLLGVFATLQGVLAAFNLGWFFQGLRKFRTAMALEALSYPTNLFFVFLLVRGQTDEVYAMVALCLSSIICLAAAYITARRDIDYSFKYLLSGLQEIKRSSIIFILSVNSILMTSGSTYFLSLLSGPTEVGYFGAAERFIALGLGFLGPASQLLMPTISSLHIHNTKDALRLARKGLLLEFCYAIVVLIAGVWLSPYVLPLVMGSKFNASVPTLQIMVCMFPFAAISHALGSYAFVPLRKEKFIAIATALGVAVNLGCALLFVPQHGSAGMAMARVASEVIIAVFLGIIALRIGILSGKIQAHRH